MNINTELNEFINRSLSLITPDKIPSDKRNAGGGKTSAFAIPEAYHYVLGFDGKFHITDGQNQPLAWAQVLLETGLKRAMSTQQQEEKLNQAK